MKKVDKILLFSVLSLMIISLFMIYSASFIWAEYKFDNPFKYVINQGIFSIVGICLLFIITNIKHEFYKKKANLILLVCIILLVLVLIFHNLLKY